MELWVKTQSCFGKQSGSVNLGLLLEFLALCLTNVLVDIPHIQRQLAWLASQDQFLQVHLFVVLHPDVAVLYQINLIDIWPQGGCKAPVFVSGDQCRQHARVWVADSNDHICQRIIVLIQHFSRERRSFESFEATPHKDYEVATQNYEVHGGGKKEGNS
jgi:hypothetical protein